MLEDWWRVWRLPTPLTENEIPVAQFLVGKTAIKTDLERFGGETLGPEFSKIDFKVPHIPSIAGFI